MSGRETRVERAAARGRLADRSSMGSQVVVVVASATKSS